jgi:hypothetical protein
MPGADRRPLAIGVSLDCEGAGAGFGLSGIWGGRSGVLISRADGGEEQIHGDQKTDVT